MAGTPTAVTPVSRSFSTTAPAPTTASEPMVRHGVLAVEMEACGLYTLAASYGREALAICTVSDHVVTGEETTSQEREQTFEPMVDIALTALLGGADREQVGVEG